MRPPNIQKHLKYNSFSIVRSDLWDIRYDTRHVFHRQNHERHTTRRTKDRPGKLKVSSGIGNKYLRLNVLGKNRCAIRLHRQKEPDQKTKIHDETDNHVQIRVSRQILIMPMSEAPVYVHKKGAGFMQVTSNKVSDQSRIDLRPRNYRRNHESAVPDNCIKTLFSQADPSPKANVRRNRS